MRFDYRVDHGIKRWLRMLADEKPLSDEAWDIDIKIFVSRSTYDPYCVGKCIHIPHPEAYDYDYALIGRTFLHELYHAYAYAVGMDEADIEDRAERYARSFSRARIRELARVCRLPNVDYWND